MPTTSVLAATAVAGALALALGACAQRTPPAAGMADKAMMEDKPMAQEVATEQCYGVARAGHNDCKAGAHACAGQSTVDADPASFIIVPAGTCEKLVGGATSPA